MKNIIKYSIFITFTVAAYLLVLFAFGLQKNTALTMVAILAFIGFLLGLARKIQPQKDLSYLDRFGQLFGAGAMASVLLALGAFVFTSVISPTFIIENSAEIQLDVMSSAIISVFIFIVGICVSLITAFSINQYYKNAHEQSNQSVDIK